MTLSDLVRMKTGVTSPGGGEEAVLEEESEVVCGVSGGVGSVKVWWVCLKEEAAVLRANPGIFSSAGVETLCRGVAGALTLLPGA